MDWRAFSRLFNKFPPSQQKYEFFLYLRFVESHFQMKGITRPIIVEIGVKDVAQSVFYEEFLNAEYIGIDVDSKNSDKIIKGNSRHLATRHKLEEKLDGRLINLLFIDGDHRYPAVKVDWEIWHPLVKNLVAFHDINFEWESLFTKVKEPSVKKLWNELYLANKSLVTFKCPGTVLVGDDDVNLWQYFSCPGIGVVILDRDVVETRYVLHRKQFEQKYGKDGYLLPFTPFHHNGGLNEV